MSNTASRVFSTGEVSPALWGRADTAAYARGLRTLQNAYVLRSGGVQSRSGAVYKGTTKDSGAARLVACVFDEDQNYVLEFGNLYVRFWRDGAPVTFAGPSAWTTTTAYPVGTLVLNDEVAYYCILAHTSGATTEPGTGASWETAWYEQPEVGTSDTYLLEIPTSYATAILSELQFAVSLGVLRIAHRTVAMEKLVRVGETQWYFAEVESEPSTPIPTNLTAEIGGVAATPGSNVAWKVTAYLASTTSESLPTAAVTANSTPADATIYELSWTAVVGATSYRIYKSLAGGAYGLVSVSTDTDWADNGGESIDYSRTPPEQQSDFTVADAYPGVLGAFQQRIFHAGSVAQPDFVRASASADLDNFTVGGSIVDSSALSYRMVNSRVVRPRHFVDVAGRLVQFSNIGEVVVEGGESGIITPTAINPRFVSQNGCAVYPAPLPVHDSALYVQARGSLVRDLRPTEAGSDLTLTASHLVDGYTITDWCYQQTPHSIVWAVRDDGVLLSLTYQRESGVFGWARHVTDGTVEAVCTVPEGTEDAVYLIVARAIEGATVRYLERLADRQVDTADIVCVDSALVAAGVGTHPHSTLSLDFAASSFNAALGVHTGVVATGSGGTGAFVAADVGRSFRVVKAGTAYRAVVTGFTSATVVTVRIVAPAGVFSQPDAITTGNWCWTSIVGLDHLEGEAVSLTLDGAVVASPNASAIAAHGLGTLTLDTSSSFYFIPIDTLTTVYATPSAGTGTLDGSVVGRHLSLTAGGVTYPARVTALYADVLMLSILEVPTSSTITDDMVIAAADWAWTSQPYTVTSSTSTTLADGIVHLANTDAFTDAIVGLPFTVDIQTLALDTPSGKSRLDSGINVKRLGAWVEEARSFHAAARFPDDANSVSGMQPVPVLDEDGNVTAAAQTGYCEVALDGAWQREGRVALRLVDPTPLTLLAIIPFFESGR